MTTFVFTPSDILVPATEYSVGLRDARRRVGLARRGRAGARRQDHRRAGRRAVPPAPRDLERGAGRGAVGPLHPVDGPPQHEARVRRDGERRPRSPGKVSFAEKDTVLVFRPAEPLPYGAQVEMLVKDSARSATGAPLAAAQSVRFRVEEKPAPAAPRSTRAADWRRARPAATRSAAAAGRRSRPTTSS